MHKINKNFPDSRVLVVEDVQILSIQYRAFIQALGCEVVVASTAAQASQQIALGPWHAALVDINLPDGSGFDIVKKISAQWQMCAVVIVTAEGSASNAIQATHAGAMDFLEKPVEPDRLLIAMRNALQACSLSTQVLALSPPIENRFHGFLGSSAPMQEVYKAIRSVAQSRVPVFVHGESGTGKELAAEAIHKSSQRLKEPFIAINCAAIPKDLIESELFGHVRGAFSGATSDRNGAFLEADKGTLFLDEVAEMDMHAQSKLLRVLQTSEVRRVGEMKHRTVNVRIICSSHKDLYKQVQLGLFREDLFYRLYVVCIELPRLSARGNDIMQIAEAMLALYAKEDRKALKLFAPDARAALLAYSWPGNVRELINLVRAIAALYDGETISMEMLPIALKTKQAIHVDRLATPESLDDDAIFLKSDICTLAETERAAIKRALQVFNGNVTRAAKALGVNASTLYRKKL